MYGLCFFTAFIIKLLLPIHKFLYVSLSNVILISFQVNFVDNFTD